MKFETFHDQHSPKPSTAGTTRRPGYHVGRRHRQCSAPGLASSSSLFVKVEQKRNVAVLGNGVRDVAPKAFKYGNHSIPKQTYYF